MTTIPNPEQAGIIASFIRKMLGLGIKAEFSRVEDGPVVTGYYLKLASEMPISKILNKAEDFALAAGVDKVVIERQRGDVVIFVPKKDRQLIDFRDVQQWVCTDPKALNLELPIILGVDHLGNKAALDLVEMPHILIAGETGSGKSVFEAAILCCLATRFAPTNLQIYLVDTKQLDLPLFRGLPHVKRTVEKLDDFHSTFDQLMIEVRRRMSLMRGVARNIREYNEYSLTTKVPELPYIIVMIDELADLIDQDKFARKGVRSYGRQRSGTIADTPTVGERLKSLVQISRASGVHVIACTQRSSVKIIDGDIKANLPCRIALRLATEADSRTILGTGGAENLLGKGDMLVQRPSCDIAERYHGPFVNMSDIEVILQQHEMIRHTFEAQVMASMALD